MKQRPEPPNVYNFTQFYLTKTYGEGMYLMCWRFFLYETPSSLVSSTVLPGLSSNHKCHIITFLFEKLFPAVTPVSWLFGHSQFLILPHESIFSYLWLWKWCKDLFLRFFFFFSWSNIRFTLAFSDGLLPLSNRYLCFLHVFFFFSCLDSSFLCSAE